MITVSIDEIQGDPLGFLRRVEAGETLLVMRDQCPVAEIKPVAAFPRQLRPHGLCAHEFTVPSDFDEPLPAGILDEFEGP